MISQQRGSQISLYLYVYPFLQKWEFELLQTYMLQGDKDHIKSKTQRYTFCLVRENFKLSYS